MQISSYSGSTQYFSLPFSLLLLFGKKEEKNQNYTKTKVSDLWSQIDNLL